MDLLQTPMQKFCLSQSLKQNIQILQMTQVELSDYIEGEVDLNPYLIKTSAPKYPINPNIVKPKSLYDDLTEQAACILSKPEQEIARHIFGNLSEEGFLKNIEVTKEILSVLKKIQTLEPAGICGLDLRDSLLIQLTRLKKRNTLAYVIIDKFFEEFINRKWKKITDHFRISVSKIHDIILKDLSKLCLRPAEKYLSEKNFCPIPDICIKYANGKLYVALNRSCLPSIALNNKLLRSTKVDKAYRTAALKIIENLCKRDALLLNIGNYLIKKEKNFFLNQSKMKLLSVNELAKFCNVHESTIHRSIKVKYLTFESNLLPLKVFFKGTTVPEANLLVSLKKIIEKESKKKPLTDVKIMQELEKCGIKISRRTVAKYRKKLKTPAASFRKMV